MVGDEIALVQRMQGRPFALLGVNADDNRQEARRLAREKGMTWPSWWNGGSEYGQIAGPWGVNVLPTIYIIDQNGIIRFPQARKNYLDKLVDVLVAGAEKAGVNR